MKLYDAKKIFMTMAVSALFSHNIFAAEEIALPKISSPAALQEGTQRTLTIAQISELIPWAKNTKMLLADSLESVQGLATEDKIERLKNGIEESVKESGAKGSELFMRYSLNRSLVILEILDKEMDASSVGASDVKLRVLTQSINLAIKYYDVDMSILSKKSPSPYKDYGVDYYKFLTDLNKSIFDASAQYNIQKTALEFLQWDLYRDLNNKSFASQIVKINNNLKFYPATKVKDTEAVNFIRQMKKFEKTLEMDEIGDQKGIGRVIDQYTRFDDETMCDNNEFKKYLNIGSSVKIIDPKVIKVGYQKKIKVRLIAQGTEKDFGVIAATVGCEGYVEFEKIDFSQK